MKSFNYIRHKFQMKTSFLWNRSCNGILEPSTQQISSIFHCISKQGVLLQLNLHSICPSLFHTYTHTRSEQNAPFQQHPLSTNYLYNADVKLTICQAVFTWLRAVMVLMIASRRFIHLLPPFFIRLLVLCRSASDCRKHTAQARQAI